MAQAIETLIAWGHSPRDVWGYTLRQMSAYIELGTMRRRQEYAHLLSINTLAARGEQKALTDAHKELTRDAIN